MKTGKLASPKIVFVFLLINSLHCQTFSQNFGRSLMIIILIMTGLCASVCVPESQLRIHSRIHCRWSTTIYEYPLLKSSHTQSHPHKRNIFKYNLRTLWILNIYGLYIRVFFSSRLCSLVKIDSLFMPSWATKSSRINVLYNWVYRECAFLCLCGANKVEI